MSKLLHNTEIVSSETGKSGLKLASIIEGEKKEDNVTPLGHDNTTGEIVRIKNSGVPYKLEVGGYTEVIGSFTGLTGSAKSNQSSISLIKGEGDDEEVISSITLGAKMKIVFTQQDVTNDIFIKFTNPVGDKYLHVVAFSEEEEVGGQVVSHPIDKSMFSYKIDEKNLYINFKKAGTYTVLVFGLPIFKYN